MNSLPSVLRVCVVYNCCAVVLAQVEQLLRNTPRPSPTAQEAVALVSKAFVLTVILIIITLWVRF